MMKAILFVVSVIILCCCCVFGGGYYVVNAQEADPPVLRNFSCYEAMIVETKDANPDWRWSKGYIDVEGDDGFEKRVILSPQFDGRTWVGNMVCPEAFDVTYTAVEGYLMPRTADLAGVEIMGMPDAWFMIISRAYLPLIGVNNEHQ